MNFIIQILFFLPIVYQQESENYINNPTKVSPNNRTTQANNNNIQLCVCDMEYGACTNKCCCDVDCSNQLIQVWINQNQCLQKSIQSVCLPSELFYYINKRMGINVIIDSENSLTCLQSDQVQVLNSFVNEVSPAPAATILQYYQNITQLLSSKITTESDALEARIYDKSIYPEADFKLFSQSGSGKCIRDQVVQSFTPILPLRCAISGLLSSGCTNKGKYDYQYYFAGTNQIYLINGQSISVKSLLYYIPTAGSEAVKLGNRRVISYQQSSCTCENAVQAIRYTFEASAALAISSVNIEVYYGTVSGCTSAASIGLIQEVQYVNMENIPLTGNAGYISGQKLYGMVAATKQFSTNGLIIQRGIDSTGKCLISAAPNSAQYDNNLVNPASYNYIQFADDATYTCFQTYATPAIFQSECVIGQFNKIVLLNNFPFTKNSFLISQYTQFTVSEENDFVVLQLQKSTIDEITAKIQFISANSTCVMVNKVILTIYYDQMGIVNDIQYFISYASLSTQTTQWVYKSAKQQYSMQFQVDFVDLGFIRVNSQQKQNPSFIPQLPSDFFYPVWYRQIYRQQKNVLLIIGFVFLMVIH